MTDHSPQRVAPMVAPDSSAGRPSRSLYRSGLLVVLTLAALPYSAGVTGYYLGDDFALVRLYRNRSLLDLIPLFWRSWSAPVFGINVPELRPFPALSYLIDSATGGGSPFSYRVTNILLHGLGASLVYTLARRAIRLSIPFATFAGALFALLQVHVETVAWITGRNESIYAVFYLGCFLAYARWRETNRRSAYLAAVFFCVAALWSKQSALTLPILLISFDRLVTRSFAGWRAYAPFGTAALVHLVIRYWAFHQAVNEERISVAAILSFWQAHTGYLQMLWFGRRAGQVLWHGLTAVLAIGSVTLAWRCLPQERRNALLFFGPVWWFVTIAPTFVAAYTTPRFLYLPGVAYAVTAGLVLEALRARRHTSLLVTLMMSALLIWHALLQRPAIQGWSRAARISATIASDVRAIGQQLPSGTLLIVDPPGRGFPPNTYPHTWIWAFALPYALQPPYQTEDLTRRLHVIWPMRVDCCFPGQWHARTVADLADWNRGANRLVVLARWDERSGSLTLASDDTDVITRSRLGELASSVSPDELQERLSALLETSVPGNSRQFR